MTQSILIPLGIGVVTADVSVPASANGRARLLLFGDQRAWNAGIQIKRLLPVVPGGGVTDFLKGHEGSSIELDGPGEYQVIRLASPYPLGVVYETGTDTAGQTITPDAPAITTASVIYTNDVATGAFVPPCSSNGRLHVKAELQPTNSASIVSAEVGDTFVAFPGANGQRVTVVNSSNVMLEYRRGSSGSAARLPPGVQRTIELPMQNANELQWRALGVTSTEKVLVTGDVTAPAPLAGCTGE